MFVPSAQCVASEARQPPQNAQGKAKALPPEAAQGQGAEHLAAPASDGAPGQMIQRMLLIEAPGLLPKAPPPGALTDGTAKNCPWCMASAVHRVKETGGFWACSNYFTKGCKWTESILQPPLLMRVPSENLFWVELGLVLGRRDSSEGKGISIAT